MIGDNVYLWGKSAHPYLPQIHNNNEERRLTSQVEKSSLLLLASATVNLPVVITTYYSGYVCTTVNRRIYYFGSWYYHDNCYHNAIFQLDTSTFFWTQVQPADDNIAVMKRGYDGMMSNEYEGQYRLLITGGFGHPPPTQVPQAQY